MPPPKNKLSAEKRYKITEVVSRDFSSFNDSVTQKKEHVIYLFQSGLQEILSILIGLSVADISERKNIPPGFCGRFEKAFSNPVLGNMLDFLLWLHKNSNDTRLAPIRSYLLSHEKKQTGWLKQMCQLRNKFYHPGKQAPEEVVSLALGFLETIPEFDKWGSFEIFSGDLIWRNFDEIIHLAPIFFLSEGKVFPPKKLSQGNRLEYFAHTSPSPDDFKQWWQDVRIHDQALESPTAVDFIGKANNLFKPSQYNGEEPEWIDKLFMNKQPGYIVDQGIPDAILCHLPERFPHAVALDLNIQEKNDILQAIANLLGFKNNPSFHDLLSWTTEGAGCLVCIRTGKTSSCDFLQVLYWLSDLVEAGESSGLRIVIERGNDQIINDMEKLWDRLPSNLDELLNSPGRKPKNLVDYVWQQNHRKGLKSFFKKIF